MSGSPSVLTLHAADPAGDEGIAEDAATLRELGCRPGQVATAILLRARKGRAVAALDAALVREQFEEAISAEPPAAVRTGILADATARIIASLLEKELKQPFNVVNTSLWLMRFGVKYTF